FTLGADRSTRAAERAGLAPGALAAPQATAAKSGSSHLSATPFLRFWRLLRKACGSSRCRRPWRVCLIAPSHLLPSRTTSAGAAYGDNRPSNVSATAGTALHPEESPSSYVRLESCRRNGRIRAVTNSRKSDRELRRWI